MKHLKVIFLLLFTFGLVFSLARPSFASTKEELQTQLLSEQEKTKLIFSDQDDLEKQLQAENVASEQMSSEHKSLNKFIRDSKKQLKQIQATLDAKQVERDSLMREIYMLQKSDVVLSIIAGADTLPGMTSKNSYLKIVLDNKLAKVKEINMALADSQQKNKNLALMQAKKTKELAKIKENEKALLNQIQTNQQKLKESQNRQTQLTSELLNMDSVGSKNDRSFVYENYSEGPNFQFEGGGTEHGVGMSQYGAKGMASQGLDYKLILNYYYKGTSLVTKNTANMNIRVLLATLKTGRITGRNGSFTVADKTISENGWVEIKDGYFNAFNPDGTATAEGTYDTLKIKALGSALLEVSYKDSNYNKYSGEIDLVSGGPLTINVLPIEQYLKGVVPAEINPSWPTAALRSQAVAARSYAIAHLGGANWDVDDTQQFQVYLGNNVQNSTSDQAVQDTIGQVLTYNGDVISAYFFSTSGGWTENNEVIWGGNPRPYLRGVASMQETDSPYWFWQTRVYSATEMTAIFSKDDRTNVGDIKSIKFENRGVSGRIIKVTLNGSSGEKSLTGEDFKYIFNKYSPAADTPLYSTLFGVK